MSNGYSSRRYQCPFFKWDECRKVHCEGGVVSLPKGEFTGFVERYCACLSGWKKCPLAVALEAYYDRVG